ncbi:MAG: hypothetical protein AAFP97_10255 [Pseudomonadota bacterium]
MRLSTFLMTFSFVTVGMLSPSAWAQDADSTEEAAAATETPPNPLTVAAQTERDLAVIEKERIEAKLAAQKAKLEYATLGLPTSEITGVDGSVKVENSGGYYAEVLAYDALSITSTAVGCGISTAIKQDFKKKSDAAEAASVDANDKLNDANNALAAASDSQKAALSQKVNDAQKAAGDASERAARAKDAYDKAIAKVVLGDVNGFGATAQLYNMLDTQFKRINPALDDILTNATYKDYFIDHSDIANNPFYTEKNSVLALFSAVQGVLGTVRGISQFFQTELTISGRAVTIDQVAVDANIAATLLQDHIVCDNPNKLADLSVALPGTGLSSSVGMMAAFDTLAKNRDDLTNKKVVVTKNLDAAIKGFEADKASILAQLKQDLANAQTNNDQDEIDRLQKLIAGELGPVKIINDKIAEAKKKQADMFAKIDPVLALANEYIKMLTTANDAGQTPMQVVSVVDQLKSSTDAFLLSARLASQGGELQMKKNSWSGSVGYLGGTVLTYMLMDSEGNIISAGQKDSVRTASKKRGTKIKKLER